MTTVTILRDLNTKQRTPKLIAAAGTKATIDHTVMNGSMVVLKIEGWKDLVCVPANHVK